MKVVEPKINPQQNVPNMSWQNQVAPRSETPPPGRIPPPTKEQPDVLVLTQKQLQKQIKESEQNLSAQYQVLLQQQQVRRWPLVNLSLRDIFVTYVSQLLFQALIEEVIHKKQEEKLHALTAQCEFTVEDLETMIQPIIDSCTKEAISVILNFLFSHFHLFSFVYAKFHFRMAKAGYSRMHIPRSIAKLSRHIY